MSDKIEEIMASAADLGEKTTETLADVAARVTADLPPEATEPPANFPKIRRQLWDVYHDDERNEIWVGVKCRFTAKGQTRPNGPVEDVELNHDAMAVMTSLDAAKQEALVALARDQQQLNEKRQRQAALKGNGILDRLNNGLGWAVNAGKSLIH